MKVSAATDGIPRLWRGAHLQQPGRECSSSLRDGKEKLAVLRQSEGSVTSAIVYSLVETAKANGLELYQYPLYSDGTSVFGEIPGTQRSGNTDAMGVVHMAGILSPENEENT